MAGDVSFEFNEGEVVEVLEQLEVGGEVAFTASYAAHQNFDTKWTSSKPPFDPLREWVDRKWGDLDNSLTDVPLEENSNLQPNSAAHKDAVAWVVVNSLFENGSEGVHFAERAISAGQSQASSIAAKYEGSDDPRAGYKIVEETIDLMFDVAQEIIAEEAYDTGNLLQSGLVELYDDPEEAGDR